MTDAKQQQRGDNVQLEIKSESKRDEKSQPDAVAKPTTWDLIERLSTNLSKYIAELKNPDIDKLGLHDLLKLSPAQKLLALKVQLLPRIHGLELWLDDQLGQHGIELSREHRQKVARFLHAMCEVAEL